MVAMARASNPRLMAQVLEAVKHLGEGRGSSARQVLEIVRQGKSGRTRNLTMQVHRALKNAVTAGLLRLRSGRYKMLISLQNTSKNRKDGPGNAAKTSAGVPAGRRKEELDNAAEDSSEFEPADAGPKSRCSHCKKHRRRSSKHRRKRGSKRRSRPTKQARERKSRKLRRRGDEESSGRRNSRRKTTSPEAPGGHRPERTVKPNPESSQEETMREPGGGSRSRSSSDTEGEDRENAAGVTRARLGPEGGRKKVQRISEPRRRNSRKRSRSPHAGSHRGADEDPEDTAMTECLDEEEPRAREVPEPDGDVCDRHSVASGGSVRRRHRNKEEEGEEE